MSDLSGAAAALGVPEAIVQRSAAARAAETGMTVDEVLAAWAGGGSVAGAAPAAAPPAADRTSAASPTSDRTSAASPAAGEAPAGPPAEQGDNAPPEKEAAPLPAAPGPVTRSPVPAEVTTAQAVNLPEVITVPTAGIRERMNIAIPRWLTAVILIIPAFALIALGGSATGECGEANQLQTDVVTGEIVNCDGSEFTGSGAGGGGSDFLAEGEAIYAAAPGACAGCHGATGGGGVGPAFGGVTTTFSSCADHIEWVSLGTSGFQADGRSTYGDSDKPVGGGGVMPPFGNALTEEQLASVVSYERVRFGGADPDQTLADCGLVTAGEEEGSTSTTTGDGATSTTVTG